MIGNSKTDEKEWAMWFGKNLQDILKTKNISQQYLAKRLGTTEAMISRYMHGTAVPSAYKTLQISNIMGCEVDELFKK